ncbi:MAG: DUF5916 domain-containing protein [Vicinamibacterales bacterium]
MIRALVVALWLVVPAVAAAGTGWPATQAPAAPPAMLPAPQAPSSPAAPSTAPAVERDAQGRPVIRAVRTPAPIRVDGRLDEPVYASTPPVDAFIQVDPAPGAPATQKTELWIFFDDQYVYATFRCWEEHPERMIVNELRRDNVAIANNEYVAVSFDTMLDRLNGSFFTISAIGGRMDGQSSNDRAVSNDPNPIWLSRTGRFEGGWIAEAAVPFKSLRVQSARTQTWGLMAMRMNRWKNEVVFINAMPPARGAGAVAMMSRAATLVGMEVPPPGLNMDVKPFATASLTTDRPTRVSNRGNADAGLDVKWSFSRSASADLTLNTDFAQVEADDAQVNLTRFNLFFPEKRDFFLENQGTFAIGGIAAGGAGAGAGDAPVLFYSRRIGLNQGLAVPIQAGGRLTGRAGKYNVGLLNIRTGDDAATGAAATNFAVARLRRDLRTRTYVGGMITSRSRGDVRATGSELYTVDGAVGFFTDFNIYGYWARSRTPGVSTGDQSFRTQLDYGSDRYAVQAEHLSVGRSFNPEIGFVRRPDMRKTYGMFRFSPRPARAQRIRKFFWTTTANYIENTSGRLETRTIDSEFAMDFQTGDRVAVSATSNHEFLPRPFRIASTVTLPVDGYDFGFIRAGYTFGQQRKVSGAVSIERGTFYNGDRTTVSVSRGRAEVSSRLSIEPTLSLNRVRLRQGDFTNTVAGTRVTATMTPFMFASALIQYASATNTLSANVRFRWEYTPGSEFFVVYNDQRDTLRPGFPDLVNRAIIMKFTRLFRY